MHDLLNGRFGKTALGTVALSTLTGYMTGDQVIWPKHQTAVLYVLQYKSSYSEVAKSLTFPTRERNLQDLGGAIASLYENLSSVQEPLGAEFEAIWDANVAALYEA